MTEGIAPAPADSVVAPRIPTLSRSRHDRAALRRDDEAWLRTAWASAKVLPISAEGTVAVRCAPGSASSDDAGASHRSVLAWTGAADVDPEAPRLFLGEVGETAYFSVAAAGEQDWLGLRDLGADLDELEAGLLTAAVALTQWHARHRHCPRCGTVTVIAAAGWSRRCPVDDSQHFPRTDPAVIMLVHDGAERCLLGRQAVWPEGRYSVLAGFVEAGESAEAAVAREVYEEAGLRIADIRYRSSQPWPFPASLMLGFTARAVGDLAITRHDRELADAGWFTRADVAGAASWPSVAPGAGDNRRGATSRLQAIPGGVSIARFLIDEWLAKGTG